MSAIHGVLSGVITIILMVVFVAIWYWAWRPHHRRTFDELAELPLEDLTGSSVIPTASGPTGRRRDGTGSAADPATGNGQRRQDQTAERRRQQPRDRQPARQAPMGWQAGPQLEQSR